MKRCLNAVWIIFYLSIFDIFINIVFHYPEDPHNIAPSFLQGYFEYGRSVEGKLATMTRHDIGDSAPRINGGWLNSEKHKSLPNKTSKSDQILVALYGMSHTQCLWEAIQKTDQRYLIRGFMAAGATPNWSYAAYEFDKDRHKADVVIIGIMSEGLSLVTSTSGATAYFDLAYPYTFPRYTVKNEKLNASYPPFLNAKGYIEFFYDRLKWPQYREWLSKNDDLYSPILFRKTVIDCSAFIRLLRRAYSEKEKLDISRSLYAKTGFNESSEEVVTLRSIIKTFAASAREANFIPIIYIVNTQGQGDKLFRILKPVLDKHKISYLSTHIICPPDDPRVFLAENSHFTLTKDMELAKAMINIIQKELEQKKIK